MTTSVRYSSDKVGGLLFGTFLGDAIGAGFDGWHPDDIPPLDAGYVMSNPPKTYTDDTQMSISVFEEMLENGRIDQHSLVRRFLKRFSPCRGYSGGMLDVIEQWRDGRDIETAARGLYSGLGNFGVGAAMRSGPISAFFAKHEVAALSEQVRACAVLTHTHPFGIAGAVLYAYAMLLALNDVPTTEWLRDFFSFPIESAYKIKLEAIHRCLERESSPHESAREIGNDADSLDAIPAALFAVLRNPVSFIDVVLFAISMGGDADTIGAMAGALAGARFGLRGIPPEWLLHLENGIEGKDFIAGLIAKATLPGA